MMMIAAMTLYAADAAALLLHSSAYCRFSPPPMRDSGALLPMLLRYGTLR